MNTHDEEHRVVIESITEAMFQLLEKKKLSEITITDLVTRAGVARTTYYRNFQTKEEVIERFIDMIFEQFEAEYPIENIRQRYTEAHIQNIFRYVVRYHHRLELIHKSELSAVFLNRLNSFLLGIAEKDATLTPQEKLHVYFLAGAEYNFIFNWYLQYPGRNREEIIKYLARQPAMC